MTETALLKLRERIAQALGWTLEDCQGFSLPQLRELVRSKDMQLDSELNDIISNQKHWFTPHTPKRRKS